MKVRYHISLPEDVQRYDGDILISADDDFDILGLPEGFEISNVRKNAAKGKISLEKGQTKSVELEVVLNAANMPVTQGRLNNFMEDPSREAKDGVWDKFDESYFPSKDLLQILREELHLLNSENKPVKEFTPEIMKTILEYVRKNFEYDVPNLNKNMDHFLKHKHGVCGDFSHLFAQMVYLAGGISKLKADNVCNLPLWDKPYFSKSMEEDEGHVYTLVGLNNKWQVVDPTVYSTSPDDVKDRAINLSQSVLYRAPEVELADILNDEMIFDAKLRKLLNNDIVIEKNIQNYKGKKCIISISFPGEPLLKDKIPVFPVSNYDCSCVSAKYKLLE